MQIDTNLQKYYESRIKEKPLIEFNYIKEVKETTILNEDFESTYKNIGTLTSEYVFRLSDGRYLFINTDSASYQEDTDPAVTIRDSSLEKSSEITTMTIGKRESDTGGFSTSSQLSIFQDGDIIYIVNTFGSIRKELHYITPSDNYSTMHTRNINFDNKLYDFFDIAKHNGIYYAVGHYMEYDSQSLKYIRKFVILKSYDMINFEIVQEHLVDIAIDNMYVRVYDNKLLITLSRGILQGNRYYYYDIDTNTIIQEDNWQNEAMYAYKNDVNGSARRNYYYDSVTGYMYYLIGDILYKQKYNEEQTEIGEFNNTTNGADVLIPFKTDTNTLTIVGVATSWSKSSVDWDGTYEINIFTTTSETNVSVEKHNLARNKTELSITYGSSAINPSINSTFFDRNGRDRLLYKTINENEQEVMIKSGRLVEVKAHFPTGHIFPLFYGRTDVKKIRLNEPIQLKAYGNMDMLDYTIDGFTFSQNYLEEVIKNLLLHHPRIKPEDIDFDLTGLSHPKQEFKSNTIMNLIKNVMDFYPDVIFYYGLDGKWKLRRIHENEIFFNFKNHMIYQDSIELDEHKRYNIIRAEYTGLFANKITAEQRNETEIELYGERVLPTVRTAIHKSQPELDEFVRRLAAIYSNGVYTITFKAHGLYPFDLNKIITLESNPLGISDTNKWVIKDIKIDRNLDTTITAESFIRSY